MKNLIAEMARFGIKIVDIQNCLGCTDKTAKGKVEGTSEISVADAFKIRDTFFPGMRIEYLFARDKS